MKSVVFLFAITLLTVLACRGQEGIRGVDFENFTYEAGFCGGEDGEKITVKNGEYSKETEVDGYPDRLYFSVFGLAYGDLDADGKEEAVIMSVCNTGGTGNFTEAYIYTMRDGKPHRILTLEGGDRAYGGLREIRIENGLMIVESYDPGEFGGACCPELIVMNTFRLKGTTLEEVGKPAKREMFPASRIEFERGKFSLRVEIELEADPGIKRFVVAASKGQRLTVTSGSADIRFRLVKGDAEVIEEDRELVANLNESGDYIFEIRGYAEKNFKTTITVTVR